MVDESCVLVEGPWTHRFVGANGSRFHVVEAGAGPLVLFLHGFPEFWWAWHDVLPRVAAVLLLGAMAGFAFVFFVAEFLPPLAGQIGTAVFGALLMASFAWIGVAIWQGSRSNA